MQTGGEGWSAKCGLPLGKKIVATIFVKFTQILENLHFCLANHACVSHLLRGQPHLLECYYWNCLIGTHMCVHPVSEWIVSFSVNCSQVAMFQIMPVLCPHGQEEGGRGGQPNVDRPGQGEERSQKFPNLCGHPLWMTL